MELMDIAYYLYMEEQENKRKEREEVNVDCKEDLVPEEPTTQEKQTW